MKKYYFLFPVMLFILATGCAKAEYNVSSDNEVEILSSEEQLALFAAHPDHRISQEHAREIAESAASMFSDVTTKSTGRSIGKSFVITRNHSVSVKSAESLNDTLLYLFNYADNGGYVFISADDRAGGILAFIEEGNFQPGDTVECPGAGILFSNMETYIRQKIRDLDHLKDSLLPQAYEKIEKFKPIVPPGQSRLETKTAPDGWIDQTGACLANIEKLPRIRPMVYTQWKQREPYNLEAPARGSSVHAPAGCTAIAVSQLIAHYNYPADCDGVPLYLSELRTKKRITMEDPVELKNKIAKFVRLVGHLCHNDWGEAGTSASLEDGRDCLRYLGYITPWKPINYNHQEIISSLNAKRPVLISGYALRESYWLFGTQHTYSEGHTWLIDGWLELKRPIETTYYYPDGSTYREITYEYDPYLHCNFGWGGSKDGYYVSGLFDAREEAPIRTKSDGAEYFYQYNLEIYPNIRLN